MQYWLHSFLHLLLQLRLPIIGRNQCRDDHHPGGRLGRCDSDRGSDHRLDIETTSSSRDRHHHSNSPCDKFLSRSGPGTGLPKPISKLPPAASATWTAVVDVLEP